MIAGVRPVSEPGGRKSGVLGEADNPVSMKKRVELLSGISTSQMVKIVLPYPLVRLILYLKKREDQFAPGFQGSVDIGDVEIRFSWIEMGKYDQ